MPSNETKIRQAIRDGFKALAMADHFATVSNNYCADGDINKAAEYADKYDAARDAAEMLAQQARFLLKGYQ